MGLLDFLKSTRKQDADESVLVQLRRVGSKLERPHLIEFFLYFPSQAVAEQAADKIRSVGFEVKVDRAAKGESWLCLATKQMIPELRALEKIREDFGALTGALGGEYDGWGTEVVDS